MKRFASLSIVILFGVLCFISITPVNGRRAYDPDSSLRRDSLYQKDGTDSVFRYLRSTGQNKYLYRIRTALYDRSGLVSSRPRFWADTLTPTVAIGQIVDISGSGFARVLSVQAQIQTNTSTPNDVPIVTVKSWTNTQAVVNMVQGNTLTIGALGVNVTGLRALQNPSSSKLHVLVVGY